MDTMEREPTTNRRRRRMLRAGLGLGTIAALGIGWYLFSPLLFNSTVIEEFPTVTTQSASATTTTTGTPGETTLSVPAQSAPPVATSVATPSSDPVALAAGEFVDADSFHQGSGTATIYELDDGSRVLRLENFDVTNGPDLHVFISPTPVPESSDDVMGPGYIDLGELKGNRGDQNYEIPADTPLPDGEFSVVIYCVPFHVVFSTATLTP
jgi:hypothetical protein